MTITESKMYEILAVISNTEAPIIFKGALITKLILKEQGFDQIERMTRDIDANWVGEKPAMDELVETNELPQGRALRISQRCSPLTGWGVWVSGTLRKRATKTFCEAEHRGMYPILKIFKMH